MTDKHPKYPLVLSVLAALVTLGLKGIAYLMTGSVGLLSDAAESLVNLVASVTSLACQWYAAKPVDRSHTYGHEKIEFFASGLEGVFILVAAGGIAWYAVTRLIAPQPLEALGFGTVVALAASLINLGVAQVLLRVGRESRSIVLEADGKHLMTDVWTSVWVVAALCFVWLTSWEMIDPIIALLVAANIAWTAFDLIRRSFNGLMDHALPEEEQAKLRLAIEGLLAPGMYFHALRTRQAGSRRFVDFHLLVPGAFTVQRAHDLTESIEQAVGAALPDVEVTVHIEPVEEKAAWHDSPLLTLEEEMRSQSEPH